MAERGGAASPRPVDAWATDLTGLAYGVSLGAGTLILPLVALDAGYSQADVGLLTAASAVAQIAVRLVLGAAMRRFPDRALVTAAGALLLMSFVVIGLSDALAPFLMAELLQGASRACFWTGLQTHVVRGDAPIVKNLARANVVANIGILAGPITAGQVMERSSGAALVVGGVLAAAAVLLSFGMQRLAPFVTADLPVRSPLLRRPGVAAGCLAVGVAGSWRGFIGAYAPVVLGAAGHAAGTIGMLIAAANAATTVSTVALARLTIRDAPRIITVASLAVAVASASIGFVASTTALAGACLLAGGLGAGALQILGSAVATEAVHEEERGEAMAVTGTSRALALFSAPLGVAGLLQLTTLAPALAVMGVVLVTPALLARRLR